MDPLPPDHIRLLCIEAGFNDAPICCRLLNTSLQASPPYEALSYTWGSLEQKSTITCGGFPIFVTGHLYDALRYLRKPDQERIMWIDAVCINQRDDKERTEQVGIMRQIYTKAWHVVIWLGRETLEDKEAFSLLSQFEDIFAEHGVIEIGPEHIQILGLPTIESSKWIALVKLFQRPWFERIWVVQEAAVCKRHSLFCNPSAERRSPQFREDLAICTRQC